LLSEIPRAWSNRLSQWLRLNRSRRVEVDGEIVPERDVEYLFYQALLGAWPPDLAPNDVAGIKRLGERIEAYMIKAVREGKRQSSWSYPNAAYEAALQRFVRAVLDASRESPFLTEFHNFVTSLARPGAVASLSQLVLKLTVPGVPDIYQGGELWDYSLVDPDNRRPVDWNIRKRLLEEVSAVSAANLAERWQDGREKLFVARRLLECRRSHPDLFAEADYQPLEVEGDRSGHLCAFARNRGDVSLIVAVPRLVHALYRGGTTADWGAAEIVLPGHGAWRDLFTGRCLVLQERVRVSDLLAEFPVCVLFCEPSAAGPRRDRDRSSLSVQSDVVEAAI
jgi:(1->4)-alpha-D-glucan 1-alpha-D-glucosylmutase